MTCTALTAQAQDSLSHTSQGRACTNDLVLGNQTKTTSTNKN